MAHIHNSTPAHHHHHVDPTHVTRALLWGIALNLIFVAIELGAGLWQKSMGLISDAGHNLSDVVSLLLALLAVKLSQAAMNDKYTYGYRKSGRASSVCSTRSPSTAASWRGSQASGS